MYAKLLFLSVIVFDICVCQTFIFVCHSFWHCFVVSIVPRCFLHHFISFLHCLASITSTSNFFLLLKAIAWNALGSIFINTSYVNTVQFLFFLKSITWHRSGSIIYECTSCVSTVQLGTGTLLGFHLSVLFLLKFIMSVLTRGCGKSIPVYRLCWMHMHMQTFCCF